jgi:hypothetical protein
MTKTEYEYLSFDLKPEQPKKTTAWYCRNKQSRDILAEVKWYPAWRQYCFFPLCLSVYNDACLADISHFLKQLDEERKLLRRKDKEICSDLQKT